MRLGDAAAASCARARRWNLTDWPLADQARLTTLALRRAAHKSLRASAWPMRLLTYARTRKPTRLLIAPQDVRTADPIIASDIYGGYFALGGKAVQLRGQSPFEVDPPSPAWSRNLMGFGWLRHLRAADTPLTRANARALVADWLGFAQHGFPGEAGESVHEPRVAARRLLSWLSHSPIILDEATLSFYKQFLTQVARETRRLQAALHEGLEGDARLLAAIALAQSSLSVEGFEGLQASHTRQLDKELQRQILADGGHVSRNPRLLAEFLVDLLPLRQAYAARNAPPPPELARAITAMIPMLRLLRHGNGEIALFNGMGATAPDLLATVLAYDDGRAFVPQYAEQSGYARLQAGDSLVIVDVGKAPQSDFSEEAHAGALSFEFSSLLNRIVVNCGAPAQEGTSLRHASRSTSAHSGLTISDESSVRFSAQTPGGASFERRILRGPGMVRIDPERTQPGKSLFVSHDGFARRFRVMHLRYLELDADGATLSGVDQVMPAGRSGTAKAQDFVLRFHLHPSVIASPTQDGVGVFLDLPGDETWYFAATDLPITLEDSIYLGAMTGPLKSAQIVIRANSAERTEISWAFQRCAPPQDDVADTPER